MAQGATFEHDVWSRARIHQDMLNEPGASMDVRYTLTRGLFFQEIFRIISVHVSVPGLKKLGWQFFSITFLGVQKPCPVPKKQWG